MNFVMDHPTIVDSDVFEDLPEYLQAEVEEMVSWHGYVFSIPFTGCLPRS